tara:strand:+ start:2648 stop:3376 length:729 start_codon:yes stop_codon:yes gene_type:complete
MSMDPNKWINTLPNINKESDLEKYKLDSNIWVNTIPKKNQTNPLKKYFLTSILFIIGLTFVFVIKNETRNLEKEIGNLEASINSLKFDLHQTRLEHEFITTPQNISKLAKEHLESNLNPYKKSQIKDLNKKSKPTAGNLKEKKEKKLTTKNKKVSEKIKIEVAKKIEKKKTDLKKLQKLYSEPEKLPSEIKTQVAKTIEIKKNELKKLYSSPKEVISLERVQQWGTIQVVKAFLGIPIIPGK